MLFRCMSLVQSYKLTYFIFISTAYYFLLAGYAFVYFEDERDAEDAIHALDNSSLGYDMRKLSVEWARLVVNQRLTKALVIINFDPIHTRVRAIKKHFEPYGNVLHVRIRRNFAFVQFETQEEATKALECTHMRFVFLLSYYFDVSSQR
ncbi:putative RNA recognition motif domain, nucleotide-binding alpha-beta plait domain superfamily [Helianthus anomalus]